MNNNKKTLKLAVVFENAWEWQNKVTTITLSRMRDEG